MVQAQVDLKHLIVLEETERNLSWNTMNDKEQISCLWYNPNHRNVIEVRKQPKIFHNRATYPVWARVKWLVPTHSNFNKEKETPYKVEKL